MFVCTSNVAKTFGFALTILEKSNKLLFRHDFLRPFHQFKIIQKHNKQYGWQQQLAAAGPVGSNKIQKHKRCSLWKSTSTSAKVVKLKVKCRKVEKYLPGLPGQVE